MSVGILVAFDCLLCTGELLQLRIADTMMNNLLTFANVDLPDSIGIMEPVSKQQLSFVSLHALYRHSQAIRVPQAFCRCLIDKFSRNNLVLKPYRYETKRCRAFSDTNSLDVVVLKGLGKPMSARIYMNRHCKPQHHFKKQRQNEPGL